MSRFAGRFLVSTVIELLLSPVALLFSRLRTQTVEGFAARVESMSECINLSWLANSMSTEAG